jgi:hypothetical protein
VRLLLLAPPGAGKGTQGERLAAWSGARHIAAGDLLRAQARAGGRLGREIAAYQARGDAADFRRQDAYSGVPGAIGAIKVNGRHLILAIRVAVQLADLEEVEA